MSAFSGNLMGAGLAGSLPGDTTRQGLAIDARSLDGLRTSDPNSPEAIRQVAQQFEALFMRQLLKSMRDAVPKSGMFESAGGDLFEGMLDSQLAGMTAGRKGSLAEVIERQLLRALPGGKSASGAAQGAMEGARILPDGTDAAAGKLPGARPAGDGIMGEGLAALSGPVRGWNPASGKPFEPAQALASVRQKKAPGEAVTGWTGGATPSASERAAAERGAEEARRIVATGRLGPVQAAFVEKMLPHARVAQQRTGLPAFWIVGQAALESGWGQRDIRDVDGNPSHNLFGIKAGGNWKGRTVASMTTEYVDGVARKSVEQFRRYESYADAFTDWARLITGNPRYERVARATNVQDFAQGLEQGGYATDPAYSQKLSRTIDTLLKSVDAQ